MKRLAAVLGNNFPPAPRLRQLLVDVSKLVRNTARGGIERVVRSILLDLLSYPPAGWVVEPVFTDEAIAGYRYARTFAAQFIGITRMQLSDEAVDAWSGDVLLCLDLDMLRPPAAQAATDAWHRKGVAVHYVVYDLLPVQLPQFFPDDAAHFVPWLHRVAHGTGAVCISQTVAQDLRNWIDIYVPPRAIAPEIAWFHLGADIDKSHPTRGLPPDASDLFAKLAAHPTFLMVATVEPRKGHRQTLAALEALWARGVAVNLVIVGRQGWYVDDLVARLAQHPERGQRLFWLNDASDEYLERLYAASTCLIAASEGEGFGLPLIEAAQHKLPILARGLPVFREVAGEHATFFNGLAPGDLAAAVEDWLASFREARHIRSDGMPWLTWQDSAAQLLRAIGIEPGRRDADRPQI